MAFGLSFSWLNPTSATSRQRGGPPPGAGKQVVAPASAMAGPRQAPMPRTNARPTRGVFSWLFPDSSASRQRGTPGVAGLQHRLPAWGTYGVPQPFGGVVEVWTPPYSRGAAAFVPNFGSVFYNPIGAGVFVTDRPQASYGPSGQYLNGTIYWAQQTVPTSTEFNGLSGPEQLKALLGSVYVQAAVRVG